MNAGYFISSILVNIQSVASQFMVENTQSMVVTVHHTASIQCHLLLVILSVFSFNIIAAKTHSYCNTFVTFAVVSKAYNRSFPIEHRK